MGLEDFERELASEQEKSKGSSRRERSRDREHRHRHRHHHSHRNHDDERLKGSDHHRKRDRPRYDDEEDRRRRKRHRSTSHERQKSAVQDKVKVFDTDDEDEWVEKETVTAPPEEDILDQRDVNQTDSKRDAWMQEPSALDIETVKSRKPEAPKGQFVTAKENHEFKIHEMEVNSHLADLENDFASDDEVEVKDEPAQHAVDYEFGDSGSAWRMTKLKNVYRQAEESGRPVEDVALTRYGDLRDFDDAREEERELDRRKLYGKEYVGVIKPSGELFQERKLDAGIRRQSSSDDKKQRVVQEEHMTEQPAPKTTMPLDASALNKLKAAMMKAKLRNAPEAARLEEEYNAANQAAMAGHAQSDVIVLDNTQNRMLAGGRQGEVMNLTGKRARERGLVEENADMSIDDMVRNEKRTKGQYGGEGRNLAERIAKDSKFENDLEYLDDNATKLSKKVIKTDTNLRNVAISDFQKMQKILESCPLCYHEEANQAPVAPVVSLATRTYLTVPTQPELVKNGAVIVPIQHRLNLLECDDDEWEEIRNFMKSLTRFYDSLDRSVIFYENAAHMHGRKGHAALFAIPLPHHMAGNAPAYFREAILSSDEQWSQHKPIIDTMALVQRPGYGKQAFRKSLAKEMPYFHVWFTLDGGMGHVIEDDRRWPKGDLFAREIIGGMLDRGPETIKRQGRWERGDPRGAAFRKKWDAFDWTKILLDQS
ncbi:hypothetical protein MRB53_039564 [Persea americana]|nr:hypothetical protein MRB53_039564 [Persea americana]